ncbi:MAG: hypothetical protein ACK4IK_06345 [Bacteroidia bacterium]
METILPKKINYKAVKVNKTSTIYQTDDLVNLRDTFLTEFVRVEKFQGFSNAYNLALYFRIKNESSWQKSKQVTGLWKTSLKNAFYGDYLSGMGKSLILFKMMPENEFMSVYVYPEGYYPSMPVIESLIKNNF